jgi:glycosyltransferase involved in cell wall biosynthesis
LGKLQIEFVCQSSMGRSDGGLETWAYQFLPALLRQYPDAQLRFIGARPVDHPDATAALLAEAGTNADRMNIRFFPIYPGKIPQIVSMFRQFLAVKSAANDPKPDIVITAGTFLELFMVLLSPLTRNAFKVTWLRTIWVDQKTYRIPKWLRPLVRRAEALILKQADLLLANGDDIAERYGRYDLKVGVIKNAVDLARWRVPPPKLCDPIKVAYIGRLALDKGIADFIQLAQQMKSGPHRDQFSFEVFGHIGQENMVREAAERGDVAWHGPVENSQLPATLAGLDVCVALTRSDPNSGGGGTSNAMMEQMAAGRIMLAWDNVIFRQWLNETNAFLAPQGDVAALAERLIELSADRDAAKKRAANGPLSVSDFGIDSMIERFDAALMAAKIGA